MYLFTLHVLDGIQQEQDETSVQLADALEGIRTALNRHEQDVQVVTGILEGILSDTQLRLNKKAQKVLTDINRAVLDSDFEQTPEERWANPLGRRLESQIQIAIITQPTPLMMNAVKKLSTHIVTILKRLQAEGSLYVDALMDELKEETNVIGFGAYKASECSGKLKKRGLQDRLPRLADVIKTLEANKPEDLIRIMCIHFKFGRVVSRNLEWISMSDESERICEIADQRMYNSPFYLGRGRAGPLKSNYTQRMGILVSNEAPESASLPLSHNSWVADSKAQAPDLSAKFTKGLINNDTPYVAGVSGMASIMIADYLVLAKKTTNEEQRLYIAAIAAYIVSGGLHCLYEVLAPIAFCLKEENLLPDFHVKESEHADQISPPDYQYFYDLICSIDPALVTILDNAWDEMMVFMREEYLPSQGIACYQPNIDILYDSKTSTHQEPRTKLDVDPSDDVDEEPEKEGYLINRAKRFRFNMIHEEDDEEEEIKEVRVELGEEDPSQVSLIGRRRIKPILISFIDSYQAEARVFGLFDLSHSEQAQYKKIESFKRLLIDTTDELTISCITLAILKSSLEGQFQTDMAAVLGYYEDPEAVFMVFDKLIREQLRASIDPQGKGMSEVQAMIGVLSAIDCMSQVDDTVSPYETKSKKGGYESALRQLEEVQQSNLRQHLKR